MKNNRIIWYEGMTLDPHHFQQWDHYYHSELNFRLGHVCSNFWGIAEIFIEKEALLNGQFQLTGLRGIMPDGLSFNLPENTSLPQTRNFADYFPATQDNLGVFLVIPHENPGSRNYELDSNSNDYETRFRLENVLVADENTGLDQREISIALANFQLLFTGESMEGFNYMKIAEVVRSPQGDFILSGEYIPPCIYIKASENLMNIVNRLLELFVARSNALRSRRRQTSSGQLAVNLPDISLYWHLSSLNSYIPLINQFLSLGKYHPQRVYEVLISLAGQLTSYATDDEILPTDFSQYEHNSLGPIFKTLENKIRRLLEEEIVPEKPYFKLDLAKLEENRFNCQINNVSLLSEADFYLVCSGNILENRPIQDLPSKFRIASPEMIDEVLRTMTNALSMSFSSNPPTGIPSKPGYFYFKFEKRGPFWKAIEEHKAISIYIPNELIGIKLELIAIKSAS